MRRVIYDANRKKRSKVLVGETGRGLIPGFFYAYFRLLRQDFIFLCRILLWNDLGLNLALI